MAIRDTDNYPGRYALSNELHARPFPELSAPCRAAFVAIKQPSRAADRDRAGDFAHLTALLDRYGAPHPAPNAGHHMAQLGRATLKWEQHTEFVTYTLFADGVSAKPFDGEVHGLFPPDWLAEAPGQILTSCLVRVETVPDEAAMDARLSNGVEDWFVPESLAVSRVVDGAAMIGADFRIDHQGHVRFAVLVREGTGRRRLGRIVQRLLEIETYKQMSMLTLPVARRVAGEVAALDRDLTVIVQEMAGKDGDDAATLDRLLGMSATIEALSSSTAFRFAAAGAYEALVSQRIQVLREERIQSRQTFGEFMMRRYDPAMRTCRSAELRLRDLSARAERAANLLRTRVDVASSAQDAEVLRRMDERAALQLRLQETVEGLSVVAISYYAVSLVANILKPFAAVKGIGEGWVYAGITLPVLLVVWVMVQRIRRRIGRH
jgi:uncharacterized membrane-anchored protein